MLFSIIQTPLQTLNPLSTGIIIPLRYPDVCRSEVLAVCMIF